MKTCNLADQKVVFGTKKLSSNYGFHQKLPFLNFFMNPGLNSHSMSRSFSVISGKVDFQGQKNSNIS